MQEQTAVYGGRNSEKDPKITRNEKSTTEMKIPLADLEDVSVAP